MSGAGSGTGLSFPKVDLLFVSWNRLEYTRLAFGALARNTAWQHVAKLVLADDDSQDGTREWLESEAAQGQIPAGVPVQFMRAPFSGPVAAGNEMIDCASPCAEAFGKIDNDFVVCTGWLEEFLRMMEAYPEFDMLGMRPDIGPPEPCPYEGRSVKDAPFIDGNGVWRYRAFAESRPAPGHSNGRFGMTEWMERNPQVRKGWLSPDLPVFTLDQLPFEPWLSLAAEYERRGWQRNWPPYHESATAYWEWFTQEQVPA